MATVSTNTALRRRLSRVVPAVALAIVLAPTLGAQRQSPTSRTIFFNTIRTTLPPSGTQDLTAQLWDDSTAGNLLFAESQPGVSDYANSLIGFVFGSQTAGGLNPALFPTGSSLTWT